jgi:RNA polymerase sigma factor (sigma-70 family)
MDDAVLLSRFVETGCQESFQQIVTRHSGWVFSLALRAVRDRHLAEDVTQAVFIILARKAGSIRQGTPLSGWLFKAARFAVSDALKRRTRMKNRENRFAEFFKAAAGTDGFAATPGADESNLPDDLSATLDEAVACLSESDRQAVLLRFYEHKSLAEVGTILGITEEAAKKRVARAVDKLRKYFASRGVVASIALLLLLLSRRADAGALIPTIVPAAAAPSIAHAIANGALQLMAHAHARLLGAIFAAGLALLVAIPTLGVAINRAIAPGPVAVTIAPQPNPLPPIPSETVDVAPPELPESPRFADLWIGYKGEILWRSDLYTDPKLTPFILKSAERQNKPYAVAVQPNGDFFIKPLDQAILQSPVVRLAQYDYDFGPPEPPARVNSMLSMIDPPSPARAVRSLIEDPPAGFTVLPHPNSKHLVDQDWHKLRRSEDDEGNILVEPVRPGSLDFSRPFGGALINPVVEVPEPSIALALLATMTTALLLRRRRRPRRDDNL